MLRYSGSIDGLTDGSHKIAAATYYPYCKSIMYAELKIPQHMKLINSQPFSKPYSPHNFTLAISFIVSAKR